MSSIPTLPGITSQLIDTPRLRMHVLFSGPDDGVPVLFIHGNASSATSWEETMLSLPSYRELLRTDCGHSPYIEKPAEFNAAFHAHLRGE